MADTTERDRLIEQNLSLVNGIAGKLRRTLGAYVDMDEMVALGRHGLVEAADRFDPTQGVSFTTFAFYRIRGAILDGMRKGSMESKANRARQRAELRSNDLLQSEAQRDAAARNKGGSSDSPAALLSSINQSLSNVATIYVTTMSANEEPEDTEGSNAEEQLLGAEMRQRVVNAIQTLPEQERHLVEQFYFKDRSLMESGADLGLSKSWASRLHARAVNLLREALETQDADGNTEAQAT